jgi:predicted SAM-dependent methyltransferase
MEKSNISNSEKNIQNKLNLFIGIVKPEFLPVGTDFVAASDIATINSNSCEEIYVGDLLDYLEYNEAMIILDTLVDKLIVSGSLAIQSADLFLLCSAVAFSDIEQQIAKLILFNNKKTIYNMQEIQTELKNRNLDIVEKKYINIFEYYIKANKK